MGLSLAITGPTSDAGDPYSKGVEDYFKFVNDMKLLGADKIDCTIRDDQYKTDVTKRNFEEFLDMGIVFYLNYSTGSTLALKKDFDALGITFDLWYGESKVHHRIPPMLQPYNHIKHRHHQLQLPLCHLNRFSMAG